MTTHNTISPHNMRLLAAAEKGAVDVVARVLQQGAAVDFPHPEDGYTALHAAAAEGHTAVLHLLLDAGANPLAVDTQGNNALMYAAYNGKEKAISALLARVPDFPIDQANHHGHNALSMSIHPQYRHYALLRLLDAGANPHALCVDEEGHGHTPHRIAQGTNRNAALIMDRYAPAPYPTISRDTLFAKQSKILSLPHGWEQFEHIAATIAENESPLTKADLLEEYYENRSYLARAAECNRLPKVMHYLHQQGEVITPSDLLNAEGKPNALLTTLIERQSLGAVMTAANWQPQGREAMQRLWRALPPEGQEQVRNYFSLNARLSQTEHTATRGR